jgi:hypothetical protein
MTGLSHTSVENYKFDKRLYHAHCLLAVRYLSVILVMEAVPFLFAWGNDKQNFGRKIGRKEST